jgi:endonuclease YncB( thermonuclease family)
VIDGDTIALTNGKRVRLLQIDRPELGSAECYSRAARTAVLRLVPEGSGVAIEADARLDKVDRYGRPLRYVKHRGINVSIRLVLNGAAAPYFYQSDRGRYASRLIAAVSRAKNTKKGLWHACPATQLSLTDPLQTRQGKPKPPAPTPPPPADGGSSSCHPSYKGACLDPNEYDYD